MFSIAGVANRRAFEAREVEGCDDGDGGIGSFHELLGAGCDALVVDIAHGHSIHAIETVRRIKRELGDVEVVAGNVATAKGAADLARAGADSVKVGVGAGSICVTRVVTGFGVPQLTAILDCAKAVGDYGVPVIGDGGIRSPGDVSKAIAGGASTVMVGSLLAGTEESPGPTILREGMRYKLTRGMASLGASIDRRVRENAAAKDDELVEEVVEESVPEGVEGLIPYKGSADEVVKELVGGLRSGMSYCGASTIPELQSNAEFLRITSAGYRESLPVGRRREGEGRGLPRGGLRRSGQVQRGEQRRPHGRARGEEAHLPSHPLGGPQGEGAPDRRRGRPRPRCPRRGAAPDPG
jgi:IMP dehydrogenase/GMP reductase